MKISDFLQNCYKRNKRLLAPGRHRLLLDKVVLPYKEDGVCFILVPYNGNGKEVTKTFHDISRSSLKEFLSNLFQIEITSIPDPDVLKILEGVVLDGTIIKGNPGYVNLLNNVIAIN